MLTDKLILALSIALCVILVWVIKAQYPSYFSQGSLFAQIATVIILGVGILIYWKLYDGPKRCMSPKQGGVLGSCNLDTDCNSANKAGTCAHTSADTCGCYCSDGWSGPNCETKGVPWNDPHCMGPNSQSPRNKSGECVCPNANWASGNDPKFGYVQCLNCSGTGSDKWGPAPSTGGDSVCTDKWKSIVLSTNNCYRPDTSSCDEFNYYLKNKGPNGEAPIVSATGLCNNSPTSCNCKYTGVSGHQTSCAINAWIDPSIPTLNCADLSKERPCQSYQCL